MGQLLFVDLNHQLPNQHMSVPCYAESSSPQRGSPCLLQTQPEEVSIPHCKTNKRAASPLLAPLPAAAAASYRLWEEENVLGMRRGLQDRACCLQSSLTGVWSQAASPGLEEAHWGVSQVDQK